MGLDVLPGNDCYNPNNYMYDINKNRVWLIDFGRWEYEPVHEN
jgi:hypothetical protein